MKVLSLFLLLFFGFLFKPLYLTLVKTLKKYADLNLGAETQLKEIQQR